MHLVYEYRGDDYQTAKDKVLSQIDLKSLDQITTNIFFIDTYDFAYEFFSKRPLYPFISSILSRIFNIGLAMLLPVFISYLGTVVVTFFIMRLTLNTFWSTAGTFILIAFYPFLDWSTYLLTDIISTFLWMTQLYVVYQVLVYKKNLLILYIGLFLFALLIREQNMLFSLLMVFVYIFSYLLKSPSQNKELLKIILMSATVSTTYLVASFVFLQNNLITTIKYTMNNYGLTNKEFELNEIIKYLLSAYTVTHKSLVQEIISHHFWFLFIFIGFLGLLLSLKNMKIIHILMISSAIASYTAIFFYPVLSYRYFIPVVISTAYFSVFFLSKISSYNQKT